MKGSVRTLALVLLVAAHTACTKPVPAEDKTPAEAASTVILYNAYTSNALAPDGSAGNPGKMFAVGDKVYVGVVLRGSAPSSKVKVEWSREGSNPLGSDEIDVPLAGATAVSIETTKHGALAPGEYKVLVYLNGTPSWELGFTVE